MSLVAATTLGIGGVEHVRTRIRAADEVRADGELRLIVQSYRADKIGGDHLPTDRAQPLASTQRAITLEELRDGVDISFLQLDADPDSDSVVVAWVERGAPTLELDALEARPSGGVYYGLAQREDGEVVLHVARG